MSSISREVENDKREISAGIVPSRMVPDKRDYLLLEHANGGHWSFPKGHVEEDEDLRETALREFREETGLTPCEMDPDFSQSTSYTFEREGQKVFKTVTYFLGIVSTEARVKLSKEHLGYCWLTYGDAREKLTYDSDRQILDEAENKLDRNQVD